MKEEEEGNRFVLNTQQSLYALLEVEIDGKVYQGKKMTRAVLAEADKLDEEDPLKNDEVLYKIVQLFFNIDSEILDKLEKREAQDIYLFVKRKFAEIDKQRLELLTNAVGVFWQQQSKQQAKREPPSQRRPGGKV